MYLSMGHMIHAPLPAALRRPEVNATCQAVLSLIVLCIQNRFFRNGVRGVIHRAPNMDTLVALGSFASFAFSTVGLVRIFLAVNSGDTARAGELFGNLYFDSAAMILALITVGKTLEAYSKGRTTDALRRLYNLAPKQARVVRDGETVVIPSEELAVGDIFLVLPGDAIPADGEILEGESAVDESALTGESIPVDKKPGDTVATATINRSGHLRCRATAVGEDNALSRIIRMVSEATATKAPIATLADRVAGVFVPVVIGIAILATGIWLAVGQTFAYALARGVSVLVISCPCALGLATPVAIMVGSGVGARHGILFKNAVALEQCGRVAAVAFDKTGTITEGTPRVTDVIPAPGVSREELLSLAAVMETYSEHPLARAVLAEAGGAPEEPEEFAALSGSGVRGMYRGKEFLAGKASLLKDGLTDEVTAGAETLAEEGKTPLFFSYGGRFLGTIAVADTLRTDSEHAVELLKKANVLPVMVTGDRAATADVIAGKVGIADIRAEVLPDGKQQVIRELQTAHAEDGLVAMVGDGINDAPALTAADVGIAIGTGTEIAVDAADVVVMNRRLTDVFAAIDLSRSTLRIIRENLVWALVYNLFGIPLAAGAFVKLLGWELNPMFGAAAMSVSSFCVVTNALRLNRWKYPALDTACACAVGEQAADGTACACAVGEQAADGTACACAVGEQAADGTACAANEAEGAPEKRTNREANGNEVRWKVEGMMCEHCEAHVKKALEAIPGVVSAVASHKAGEVTITLSEPVDAAVLKAAIEGEGYRVR